MTSSVSVDSMESCASADLSLDRLPVTETVEASRACSMRLDY